MCVCSVIQNKGEAGHKTYTFHTCVLLSEIMIVCRHDNSDPSASCHCHVCQEKAIWYEVMWYVDDGVCVIWSKVMTVPFKALVSFCSFHWHPAAYLHAAWACVCVRVCCYTEAFSCHYISHALLTALVCADTKLIKTNESV